ncbi:putative DEAD/H, partial [Operophtera brumata]
MQKSKTKSTSVGEDGKVLKKSKTKACSACLYYNQTNIIKLKERMLVDILDMEDLVKCGKELKACPYYASRMALDDAEVVLISHAGIVSAGARAGISLKLTNNILILDEAHGLTAALENAHSAPVSGKQLCAVKTCLQYYVAKYRARLVASSLSLLTNNILILDEAHGLTAALENAHSAPVSGKQLCAVKTCLQYYLTNNILILDEAHGLTAALENAHSAPVSGKQLCAVKTCLQYYVAKYRARLLTNNLLILDETHGLTVALENAHSAPVSGKQLCAMKTCLQYYVAKQILFYFSGMINPKPEKKDNDTKIFTSEDFVIKAEIDHMNLRPLIDFCRNTRLAPKLHGFSMRYSQQQLEDEMNNTVSMKSNFQSGLYAILEFLVRLCERSDNGRVLTQGGAGGQLKYLLLNPNEHFASVVEQCRSKTTLEFMARLCERSDNRRVLTQRGAGGQLNYLLLIPTEHFASVVEECRSNTTLEFLAHLCERSDNGRVLTQGGAGGQLKYLLLNPNEHFASVVEQCRSVSIAVTSRRLPSSSWRVSASAATTDAC